MCTDPTDKPVPWGTDWCASLVDQLKTSPWFSSVVDVDGLSERDVCFKKTKFDKHGTEVGLSGCDSFNKRLVKDFLKPVYIKKIK